MSSSKVNYHKKDILRQIAKASEAIRRKHRLLKLGKETFDQNLNDTFKPIVTPLEKIVHDFENVKKINPIKNEVPEDFKQDFQEGLEEQHDDNDNDDDDDDETSFQSAYDSKISENLETISPPLLSDDNIAIEYLSKLEKRNKDLDNVYGVRKLSKDRLMIGNSSISFNKNHIDIGTASYPKTKGLLELLFKKTPDSTHINNEDLENYKDIIISTNAHRKHYKVDGEVRDSKSLKYTNFVKKLITVSPLKTNRHSRKRSSLGKGLIPKYMISTEDNKLDYVYWDDPNELVDRLRLLLASQAAGNPNHSNEILSIIEELREAGIIY